MNRAELMDTIAKEADISKALAGRLLDGVIDTVTQTLKKGNSVVLTGFGTFSVARRKARTGRNPRTGREIKIPARKVTKFKAGAKLAKAVR